MVRSFIGLALALPLAACATTPPTDEPAETSACPPSSGWRAWIDAMPGPGKSPTLLISGEVDIPAGMVAELRPGPLDRMMPPGQRFVLELRKGEGPSGRQAVTGRVMPSQNVYREVIVGCGGNEIARIDGSAIETAR